jgi:hypothetical protein
VLPDEIAELTKGGEEKIGCDYEMQGWSWGVGGGVVLRGGPKKKEVVETMRRGGGGWMGRGDGGEKNWGGG